MGLARGTMMDSKGFIPIRLLSLGRRQRRVKSNKNDQSPAAQAARNDARRLARLEKR